ncbi:MAG: ATP-binding protein [Rhodothermia bacterium]|nr:MAG: ATP-binding protein [Rhodothermia bacterium]
MTTADVQRLAKRGEGATLEFKHRTPEPERLAKEVIAFANTNGGRLLIGVDDNGTVLGVKDSEEEEFALRNALDAHCSPPLKWHTERVEISRKRDVIVIAVPRSKDRPHGLISSNGHRETIPYVRVGDRSIEASSEAIELMLEEKDQDVQFEFGEHELALMEYLDEYSRIGVDSFARFVDVNQDYARRILVILMRAGVLSHHLDYEGDYFTLVTNGVN